VIRFLSSWRRLLVRRGLVFVVSCMTLLTLSILIVVRGPGIELATAGDTLLFVGGFETGDLTGFYWSYNKPQVVSAPHPVRDGQYSLRNYLHRYESEYPHRCDLHVNEDDTLPEGVRQVMRLELGGEYWFGFSVYIPPDFVPDLPGRDEVLFQIHGSPDRDNEGNYIEDWRNPPFSLRVEEQNWLFRWFADSKAITPPSGTPDRYTYFNEVSQPLGTDIGKWTDFVVNIKFDYSTGGSGFTTIWKDGELIVDLREPNCFNDYEGPYPAVGLYKWSWNGDWESNMESRLFYFDEFRIGDASASYEDVAPGQSAPAPTATPGATPTATPTPTVTPSGTSTPTVTATATSTPMPAGNLIANGGFEEGTTNWYFHTDGQGSATTVAPGYIGSQSMEVSIDQESSTTQLYQYNVPLKPSTSYRLSFAAKSSAGHCIEVRIHEHPSPYSDYTGEGYKQFELTTDWSVKTWDFTTLADAGDDARLRFWFGPCDASGDVYWIDDVELVETEAPGPPTSTPTSTASPTSTATASATPTSSSTATSTTTASPTSTQSATPSSTSTAEHTFTPTATSTATSTHHPDETIIDDLDPGFTINSSQDAWQQHSEEGGEHFGTSHYYNPQPGEGQDTAVWSFAVDRPGKYDVYAWWWEADWRPPDVPYTINHLGGSTTVRVSQRTDGGAWYPMGVFDFQDQGSVVVSDDVSSGLDIVADAIRLVYRGPLLSATATSTGTPTSTASVTPTPAQATTPTPTATQTPVPGEVVIDDLDDGFSESSSQDSWGEYVEPGGRHYGGAHHYNSQVGTGRDTAEWHFAVPKSGFYEVYAWWWEAAWRPADVPYVIDHLGGSTTVRVDQRTSGGQWNLLGCFYFKNQGSIVVSDDVSSGHDVVADAVRLVYLSQNPPGWGRRLFLPAITCSMK
jgi:hypothetical protein